jgi:hypothetical protein
MGRKGPPIPTDNVYLIETADDLPDILSQWTLYNLQFDPGSGAGLYFSPDGLSLVRLAAGGGGGGVASFNARIGIVTSVIADYAGFYVDSFNTRTGPVVAIQADYAGFYVDSFEGRTGAVVAVDDDYEDFYLVKGVFLAGQSVVSDVTFSGSIEFTNIFGLRLGPSCELDMESPDGNTIWFTQYGTFFCEWGLAGPDFEDIFFIFSKSFNHYRFDSPILLKERAIPFNGPGTYGQLWVRDDSPTTLMYTDDEDNDFTVDVTPA